MALGSTQPLTEMSTRSISWEWKGARCVRLTTLPPSCAVVMKSGNFNFLEPSEPLQACNGTPRRQLEVNVKPRALYPLERTGTHGIVGWVDVWTGLKRYGKFRPIGVEELDRPVCSELLWVKEYQYKIKRVYLSLETGKWDVILGNRT